MAEKDFVVKNGIVVGEDASINGTGAIKIPAGTALERPVPVTGQIRFNTDLNSFEGYNGTGWGSLAEGGSEIDPEFVQAIASIAITNDTTKLDRRKNLSDVTSARAARKNILPSQAENQDKLLFTDGNDVIWDNTARIREDNPDDVARTITLLSM